MYAPVAARLSGQHARLMLFAAIATSSLNRLNDTYADLTAIRGGRLKMLKLTQKLLGLCGAWTLITREIGVPARSLVQRCAKDGE